MSEQAFKVGRHEAAMEFIRSKPAVAGAVFRRMLPELRARAFTIAGVESATVLQRVRNRLADLPAGAAWDDVRKDVKSALLPWFVDPDGDDETRAKQEAAAGRRAELLLRTHGFQAYQAAQWNAMQETKDALPYWQYMTAQDDAVRPEHAALDGLVLPADSPFWRDHFPPWDWGCRCQVVAIGEEDRAEIAAGRAGYGRVLSPTLERELEQSGRLALDGGRMINVSSPSARGVDGAFQWNPGDLRIPLKDLRERYDEDVWKAFEEAMKGAVIPETKTTVWEWLDGGVILPPTAPVKLPVAATETIDSVLKDRKLAGKTAWTAAEIRGLADDLREDTPAKLSSVLAAATVQGAEKTGALSRKSILRQVQDVLRMLPPDVVKGLPKMTITVRPSHPDYLRSYGAGQLTLYRDNLKNSAMGLAATVRETVFHELGHWIHDDAPDWYRAAVRDLYASRTKTDTPIPDKYGWIRPDRWWWNYAGRQYFWEPVAQGKEVVTTHLELLANPDRMSHIMKYWSNGDTIAETLRTVLAVFFRKP